MVEIIECGAVESEESLHQLARKYGHIIIPEEDDADLTHWWLLRDDGVEATYFGTAASFDVFVRERNGGLQ